jgi:hypothetical protein
MACLQRLVALRHSSRIVARPTTVRFFNRYGICIESRDQHYSLEEIASSIGYQCRRSTSANLDEKDARPAEAGKNAPLTFEQYRELKNKVKTRSRIAGKPFAIDRTATILLFICKQAVS